MLTDEQRALFEGRNIAHLATVMPDGSPQVSPVWVEMDGDFIVVNTREERLKTANMQRDPRVAISITDHDDFRDRVIVRGVVEEITPEGGAEGIDRLARKYDRVDRYDDHHPEYARVIVRIRPTRVSR